MMPLSLVGFFDDDRTLSLHFPCVFAVDTGLSAIGAARLAFCNTGQLARHRHAG
jgi:hypothetical protein